MKCCVRGGGGGGLDLESPGLCVAGPGAQSSGNVYWNLRVKGLGFQTVATEDPHEDV